MRNSDGLEEPTPSEIVNGIPVFKPTWAEFKDFERYVRSIEHAGMRSGVVKIIPPDEWLKRSGTPSEERLSMVKIRKPILQVLSGNNGVYTLRNVEQRRSYNLKEWKQLCQKNAPRHDSIKTDLLDPAGCARLERIYWQTIAESSPIYGADTPGSLFESSLTEWNVASLPSPLQRLQIKVPGVNEAYLYCGMWKASFAWHLEDMDLPSINYIHFGAPKQWYSIPQSEKDQFFKVMKDKFPSDYRKCHEFLRHKTFLVSPAALAAEGIRVNSITHHANEFIITWPYGYHAGFNYGYNCAESVNFATDAWTAIGLASKSCQCIPDSVAFNVTQMLGIEEEVESEASAKTKTRKTNVQARVSAQAAPRVIKRELELSDPDDYFPGLQPLRRCCLCPNQWTGELVESFNSHAFAHVLCTNFIPETWLETERDRKVIHGLKSVPRSRFKLRCEGCGIRAGACVQCRHPRCACSFHPTCALKSGCQIDNFTIFCPKHRSMQKPDPFVLLPGDSAQICKMQPNLPSLHMQSKNLQAKSRSLSGIYAAGLIVENDRSNKLVSLLLHPNLVEQKQFEYGSICGTADYITG